MKRVRYVGPVFDHSGYGCASRNYVLALDKAGVPLTVEPHCFETNPPPVGTPEEREALLRLTNRREDFDVLIVHLTPDLLPQYVRKYPNKYIISYTVWETSHIPELWAKCCNLAKEVWVPCDWNVAAFTDSGVTVPVRKIHHGISPQMFDGVSTTDFTVEGVDKSEVFVFNSVMQWNARKNPEGLLRSYFATFRQEEPVRLVLKAYVGRGFSPQEEAKKLREAIQRIKSDMQLQGFPKMNLITSSLSEEQMRQFYMYGDCYVSLTHGEGFGLTMFEAGLAGKPVIATDKGGNMEYMTPENSYPVPSIWDLVHGMSTFNPWYLGNQQWARPSLVEASRLMRHVFENREEAAAKGALLRERIINEFSWDRVAGQMVNRLKEL